MLKFTTELSVSNRIPFLDLDVNGQGEAFKTKVHRKSTNSGKTTNGESECPKRYHTSVIRAFIRRAIKYCSEWEDVHMELRRSKQILVNNGYSNHDIDQEIRSQIDRVNGKRAEDKQDTITLFVRNQMSSAHRTDERVLRHIVLSNTRSTQDNVKIKVQIYYKSRKIHNLVMKNNLTKNDDKLKRTNVIYK